MMQFMLHEFVIRWDELKAYKRHYEFHGRNSAGQSVTGEDLANLQSTVTNLNHECKKLNITKSVDRLWRFQLRFERGESCSYSMVMVELETIEKLIESEMDDNYFAIIPAVKKKFFENNSLFGKEVNDVFPGAVQDIMDAGNCIAADLNTAAVFHLMRVAEVGLKKLSKPFKVKLPNRIEFSTWGEILRAIENEMNKKGSRTPAKEKKLQHHSQLLLEIRAFMHLWRNPVSHLRGNYDAPQAQSAFNHVCSFMQKASITGLPR